MRFWIVETRSTLAGHEIDFDRLLVEELSDLGHEVTLVLPCGLKTKVEYPRAGLRHLSTKGVERHRGGPFWLKWLDSLKVEKTRRDLFNELEELDGYDALIFPTATHRFMRTFRLSHLSGTRPVYFIIHGLKPGEARSISGSMRLRYGKTPRILVLSINSDINMSHPSVRFQPPPVYVPRDVSLCSAPGGQVLRLGFFGQYRREKNLPALLRAILEAKLKRPVHFTIQGAAAGARDQQELDALALEFSALDDRLEFITTPLIGPVWQEAILGQDALILPYGAKRFRWHWSGMLFTAIGHQRPVLVDEMVNPEVMARFDLGLSFSLSEPGDLTRALEEFVNNFDADRYRVGLEAANSCYNPRKMAESLVNWSK